LLGDGLTNREIAGELVISVHTVERHLATIYRKIGVRNRTDATAFAYKSGLANT
jgi:DNA-binding NarL/FixJ family response regulator